MRDATPKTTIGKPASPLTPKRSVVKVVNQGPCSCWQAAVINCLLSVLPAAQARLDIVSETADQLLLGSVELYKLYLKRTDPSTFEKIMLKEAALDEEDRTIKRAVEQRHGVCVYFKNMDSRTFPRTGESMDDAIPEDVDNEWEASVRQLYGDLGVALTSDSLGLPKGGHVQNFLNAMIAHFEIPVISTSIAIDLTYLPMHVNISNSWDYAKESSLIVYGYRDSESGVTGHAWVIHMYGDKKVCMNQGNVYRGDDAVSEHRRLFHKYKHKIGCIKVESEIQRRALEFQPSQQRSLITKILSKVGILKANSQK